MQKSLPPKRIRNPTTVANSTPLEKDVLAAVGDLLSRHPRVLLAVRQNSGAMPYDRDGRAVPVWFYKLVRVPKSMTLVDYWGFLTDGKPFGFECKRPSWSGVKDEREKRQQACLEMIECIGGISRFVTDVSQVAGALA